jgi:hypothetical protein
LAIEDQKGLDKGFTIKEIVNNLSQKYIDMKSVGCMTPEAVRNPLTNRILSLPMNEGSIIRPISE